MGNGELRSDVNKDLGLKSKAKDFVHKTKAKDLGPKAKDKAKDSRCQGQMFQRSFYIVL